MKNFFKNIFEKMKTILMNRKKYQQIPNQSVSFRQIPIDFFKLKHDNEMISLFDYLSFPDKYIPNYLEKNSLVDQQDIVIQTTIQSCVFPNDDKNEKVDFAVQIYDNELIYSNSPSYLIIISSESETSVQILERETQNLFCNKNGRTFWFRAEKNEKHLPLIIFQIPLEKSKKKIENIIFDKEFRSDSPCQTTNYNRKNFEETEFGPYFGIKNFSPLVRDKSRPILCTIQNYSF